MGSMGGFTCSVIFHKSLDSMQKTLDATKNKYYPINYILQGKYGTIENLKDCLKGIMADSLLRRKIIKMKKKTYLKSNISLLFIIFLYVACITTNGILYGYQYCDTEATNPVAMLVVDSEIDAEYVDQIHNRDTSDKDICISNKIEATKKITHFRYSSENLGFISGFEILLFVLVLIVCFSLVFRLPDVLTLVNLKIRLND
ncbi:MAG: hypothetical protein K0S47_2084 [Herbinix sp.]|jgi:hypothetical protein|nr:hypothetical protein [Herbinix sp.]